MTLSTPETLARIILLPFISLLFAYLEQGGNLFAEQTIDKPRPGNLLATLFFSMIYAFVAALISIILRVNLALMMVNYGFGFSIVSLLLELKWGKLPSFTLERVRNNPKLKVILLIAGLGFIASSFFVVAAP